MYSDQKICIIAYKVIIKCAALLYSGILLFCAHRGPTRSAAQWATSRQGNFLAAFRIAIRLFSGGCS